MKKKQIRTETVATISVKDPHNFSKSGAKRVAAWMRKRAAEIERYYKGLTTGTFRARYICAK